jgi:hypothetical protein
MLFPPHHGSLPHYAQPCGFLSPASPPAFFDLRNLLLLPLMNLLLSVSLRKQQGLGAVGGGGGGVQYRLSRSFTVATGSLDAGIRCIHSPQRILRHLGDDFSLIPNSTTRPVAPSSSSSPSSVIMSFGIRGPRQMGGGSGGPAAAAEPSTSSSSQQCCWSARIMSEHRSESALFLMDNATLMPVALAKLRVATTTTDGRAATQQQAPSGYTVSVDAIFFDAGAPMGAWLALNWLSPVLLHGIGAAGGPSWGGSSRRRDHRRSRCPSSSSVSSDHRADRTLLRRYARIAGSLR